MLSHHEIGTLLTLANREMRVQTLDPNMRALQTRQLIETQDRAPGWIIVRLTDSGRALLQRLQVES
ncbi:DNA-binding PadR family transcriptional regulator [Paraburkholderia youngii]